MNMQEIKVFYYKVEAKPLGIIEKCKKIRRNLMSKLNKHHEPSMVTRFTDNANIESRPAFGLMLQKLKEAQMKHDQVIVSVASLHDFGATSIADFENMIGEILKNGGNISSDKEGIAINSDALKIRNKNFDPEYPARGLFRMLGTNPLSWSPQKNDKLKEFVSTSTKKWNKSTPGIVRLPKRNGNGQIEI